MANNNSQHNNQNQQQPPQMPPQGQMPPMPFGPQMGPGGMQNALMSMLGKRTAWYFKLIFSFVFGFGLLFLMWLIFPRVGYEHDGAAATGLFQGMYDYFDNHALTGIQIDAYWKSFFVVIFAAAVQFGFMSLFIFKTKAIFADATTWVFAWTGMWAAFYCFPDTTLWLVLPLGLISSLGLVIAMQIVFAIMIYRSQLKKLGIDPEQIKAMFNQDIRMMQQTRGQAPGQPNQPPISKKDLDEQLRAQGIDIDALDKEFGSAFEDEAEVVDNKPKTNANIKVSMKTTKVIDESGTTKPAPKSNTKTTSSSTESKPKTSSSNKTKK